MPREVETIYVTLLNESPGTLRAVQAVGRAHGVYQIISTNDDPESECWQFPPGSLVRCEQRHFPVESALVAVSMVEPPSLHLVR